MALAWFSCNKIPQMTHDDVPVEVSVEPTIRCDDFFMARDFIESGLGIGYLPDLMVRGRRSRVRRVFRTIARRARRISSTFRPCARPAFHPGR